MPPFSSENEGACDSSATRESGEAGASEAPKSAATPDLQNHLFILDSVAPEHATGSQELLSGTRHPDGSSDGTSFRTRSREDLPVVSVGSINTPQFTLSDVLLVPALGPGRILVSVRQLVRRNLAVSFGIDSCHVKGRTTGDVVGEGRLREEDGLYHLDFLRIPES